MIKEAWGMLSSTLDVQTAMMDMEKRQEKGELPEEEMEKLNKDLVGKVVTSDFIQVAESAHLPPLIYFYAQLLLISWKGTRFESGAILRLPTVTDETIMNRAKALLLIGLIFKEVQPDESDGERRELERLLVNPLKPQEHRCPSLWLAESTLTHLTQQLSDKHPLQPQKPETETRSSNSLPFDLGRFSFRYYLWASHSNRNQIRIAIIRIDGPQAVEVYHSITRPIRPTATQAQAQNVIDPEAVLLRFDHPKQAASNIEFHLHGSPAVAKALLSTLSKIDHLRLAQPGEFTRRRFDRAHGSMDINKILGLKHLIDAETEEQRRWAVSEFDSKFDQTYQEMRRKLKSSMALCEAIIDFSEDGSIDDRETWKQVIDHLIDLQSTINDQLSHSQRREKISMGIKVSLYGSPNVGKSTLFNYLVNREAAIVSPYPGTTRDIIEVSIDYHGFPIILSDTAGLRSSTDPVEEIGIGRAKENIGKADVRLLLVSATDEISFHNQDSVLEREAEDNRPTMILVTKTDLIDDSSRSIDGLIKKLKFHFLASSYGSDALDKQNSFYLTNYQKIQLEKILSHIETFINRLSVHLSGPSSEEDQHTDQDLDLVILIEELRLVSGLLSKLSFTNLPPSQLDHHHHSHEISTEEILGEIFQSFWLPSALVTKRTAPSGNRRPPFHQVQIHRGQVLSGRSIRNAKPAPPSTASSGTRLWHSIVPSTSPHQAWTWVTHGTPGRPLPSTAELPSQGDLNFKELSNTLEVRVLNDSGHMTPAGGPKPSCDQSRRGESPCKAPEALKKPRALRRESRCTSQVRMLSSTNILGRSPAHFTRSDRYKLDTDYANKASKHTSTAPNPKFFGGSRPSTLPPPKSSRGPFWSHLPGNEFIREHYSCQILDWDPPKDIDQKAALAAHAMVIELKNAVAAKAAGVYLNALHDSHMIYIPFVYKIMTKKLKAHHEASIPKLFERERLTFTKNRAVNYRFRFVNHEAKLVKLLSDGRVPLKRSNYQLTATAEYLNLRFQPPRNQLDSHYLEDIVAMEETKNSLITRLKSQAEVINRGILDILAVFPSDPRDWTNSPFRNYLKEVLVRKNRHPQSLPLSGTNIPFTIQQKIAEIVYSVDPLQEQSLATPIKYHTRSDDYFAILGDFDLDLRSEKRAPTLLPKIIHDYFETKFNKLEKVQQRILSQTIPQQSPTRR
ncbi:hypothetical protein KEM48_011110 [Puccinia striiformis f. sp. tritici PST-130]|nr:hypothetical protein KEM48_011110 [Puccinia striiformis f. sp. tritici PST-130]